MNEREDMFSSHPTRKPVLDFMRILLMDSLLNVSANTNTTHPLVLLLEVNSHYLFFFFPAFSQTWHK